jgi:GDP-4-dehydro-6-deoxy-D-mannose reductase
VKALIVGINGFAGQHLLYELCQYGHEVYGIDISGTNPKVFIADILNKDDVMAVIKKIEPDCIFNLAAQASVSLSWTNPQMTFDINVKGTLNLLDAVHSVTKRIRVVIVGSSDQYGLLRRDECPIDESFRINPQSPYAISKQAQENMVQAYIHTYGMDIVMTRSFNHIGPGQRKGFVVADLASQIAEIEKGIRPALTIGNMEAIRDFTDVRDVVCAYRLLYEKGKSGDVYNVGSGCIYSIKQILDILLEYSESDIDVKKDPQKMRPSDLPFIQCNYTKLKLHTGWSPAICIRRSLKDTLEYWRFVIKG